MESNEHPTSADLSALGAGAARSSRVLTLAGLIGLGVALVAGLNSGGAGYRRFLFAYLVALCFCLTIALGALAFVLLQHLTRAGWSVTVRRPAEALAAAIPVLGLLSLPLLVSVARSDGALYRWALPLSAAVIEEVSPAAGHGSSAHAHDGGEADPAQFAAPVLDPLTLKKRAWLNPTFWIIRVVGYFAIWTFIARWYRAQSIQQDRDGDQMLTARMRWWAPFAVIVTAVAMTGAAFDLMMSLDPHWYSTIFGVYFLAGSFVSSFAALIVTAVLLQRAGFVRTTIGTEHFHDLGKYLFAFVFFWGYIAFSQYMLLWYANLPEETQWFSRRGVTTVKADISGWSFMAVAILFGHLLIPFAGLLSRHVKRNARVLAFWAVWLLAFHYVDLYWVIMPEAGGGLNFKLIDLAALIAVLGFFAAAVLRLLAGGKLIPTGDPRLPEALAFHNI